MKAHIVRFFAKIAPRLFFSYQVRRRIGFDEVFWLIPELCDAAKVSVDIGANEGRWSAYIARFSRLVYAFEPNPGLQRSLAKLVPSNVVVSTDALSDSEGFADLRFPGAHAGCGTIETANSLTGYDAAIVTAVRVTKRSLESLGLTGVGFIKIDVEGHEAAVLNGATALLKRDKPNLIVELENRHRPDAIGQAVQLLHDLGYECFFVKNSRIEPYATFDETVDQVLGAPAGQYINNFVFVHQSNRQLIGAMMRRNEQEPAR